MSAPLSRLPTTRNEKENTMTTLTHIPLDQLHVWSGNVRKSRSKAFIAELATSIREHGLWQNLVVCPDENGHAVIAGAQRLKALRGDQ